MIHSTEPDKPDLSARTLRRWAATLALGAAGGWLAGLIGLPLPWLLGALAATATAAASGVRLAGGPPTLPQTARLLFIPVIGVLIGGAFTPETAARLWEWLPGLIAVVMFVPAALGFNYWLYHRVAGLDRPTAFFAGMPGGLIESIEMGGEQGADMRALTVLQFSRIALTVSAVPLLYAVMQGQAVGSAAGMAFAPAAPLGLGDGLLLAAAGVVGFFGARRVGLPAGQITGPILASAAIHALGWTEAAPPPALVAMAQLVIGTHLGLRFNGLTGAELKRYLRLSAASVAGMLGIGAGFAGLCAALGVAPFAVMWLCFAPGGLVEMGLIALSLNASPIFVTAHHFARIVATVTFGPRRWRRMTAQTESR